MRVLIVEDEKRLAQALGQIMEEQRYQVDIVYAGQDGLDYALSGQYDIVVLDVMLPKKDGFEVVRQLREVNQSVPVLMLTARDDVTDKVLGLDCGADDYMTKPLLPKELLLRLSAILRRSYKNEKTVIELAHCTIDFDKAEINRQGETFPLTAREHAILNVSYKSANRIVTMDALCAEAWGDNLYGYENSLMAHIRRIREKIEMTPSSPESLITIKGLGYKLIL